MKVVGVIPARLKSTRLTRKMLREVLGKTLIQRTYENAKQAASLAEVIVACDDEAVRSAVESFGGRAWLTRKDHASGTSRIAELAERLEADVVVNIQGDEPLLKPEAIDLVTEAFRTDSRRRSGGAERAFHVATLAVPKEDEAEYRNPNVVKVVKDQDDFALYFSRSPIPCFRDGAFRGFLKHLGIYAYTREFLVSHWNHLKPSVLEDKEKLEQLRILDNGFRIKVLVTDQDSIGVDTEEDLKRVEEVLRRR